MRLGEVLALTWGNIDLENRNIAVSKSLSKKGTPKCPKSKAGLRTICVDSHTAERLSDWKEFQASALSRLSMTQSDDTPVCCTDAGGFSCKQNFERWWKAWRADKGFPDLKFHKLRHTQAT